MCNSCESLGINGVLCHEIGCPDAWRDYVRECKWCGRQFSPDDRDQTCCDESCAAVYHGFPDPDPLAAALDACDGDIELVPPEPTKYDDDDYTDDDYGN